jgi:glycosyltransferase involved in cell wall biosynthesis
MNERTLVWSSEYSMEDGQSIVTRAVVHEFLVKHFSCSERLYRRGVFGLLHGLALGIFCLCDLKKYDFIYLVNSRSWLGFIRDSCILFRFRLRTEVLVCHVHGSDFHHLYEHKFFGFLVRWLYSGARFIVPSYHLVDRMVAAGFVGVSVVENFYSHHESGPYLKSSGKSRIVLWNSNLIASKGLFEFLRLAKVFHKSSDYQFVTIGRAIADNLAGESDIVMAMSEAINHGYITHLGEVSVESAINLAAESDIIFLFSSYASECQPLAVIQGMCSGCSLVLRDTSALRATAGSYPAFYCSSFDDVFRLFSCRAFDCVDLVHVRQARNRFSFEHFISRFEAVFGLF